MKVRHRSQSAANRSDVTSFVALAHVDGGKEGAALRDNAVRVAQIVIELDGYLVKVCVFTLAEVGDESPCCTA